VTRLTNRLTAMAVRNLSAPGRHPDGNGLYLSVGPTGGKSWAFLYKNKGRRVELGLGSAHAVSLNQARSKAQEAAQLRAQGIDPRVAWRSNQEANENCTFGDAALDLIASREEGWKNAKHRQQWRNSLETHAASIWNQPVGEITVEGILAVLRPIWTSKAETARRVRGRIERILDAAKVRGLRSGENPALFRGNLALLLPKQSTGAKRHHPAMPYSDVTQFMGELRDRDGAAARALEVLIHTALRTSEVLGARWEEIDIANRLWTIPAERMKAGKEHRVPLTDKAIALLEALPKRTEFVFPSAINPKKTLSNMAMAMVLQRMGLRQKYTVHGFRSTFRDWVHEETDYQREIAELALAHQVGSEVERSYRRGDALDKRRKLMEDWSAYLG
jgi:integrase